MQSNEDAKHFEAMIDVLMQRYKSQAREDALERRVVLVVGAGVSLGSELPLWSNPALKERLLEVAEGHYRDLQGFVATAWDRLGPRLGLPPSPNLRQPTAARERLRDDASLDELCAIACEDPLLREKILSELVEWFAPWSGTKRPTDGGPPPQLAYELIAHLLKHRFIDHIVSFNFDEVLDTAIASEFAPDDYVLITSDHHMLTAEKPIRPHVIKIHGTISQPETLRFTVAQTGFLTREMRRLLDQVICAPPAAGKKLRLDIISLGYSWQDRDFAHYVYKHSDEIGTVVVVMACRDNYEKAMIQPKNLYRDTSQPGLDSIAKFVSSDAFAENRIPSVDLILWSAWKVLAARLEEAKYAVMSIARHLILAGLFARNWTAAAADESSTGSTALCPMPAFKSQPLDWIKEGAAIAHTRDYRFRAELLLHAIECKGMVNISVMAHNCRLNHYRPKSPKKGKDILSTIDFLKRDANSDFKETYFADASTVDELRSQLKQLLPLPCDRKTVVTIPSYETDPEFSLSFDQTRPLEEFLDERVGGSVRRRGGRGGPQRRPPGRCGRSRIPSRLRRTWSCRIARRNSWNRSRARGHTCSSWQRVARGWKPVGSEISSRQGQNRRASCASTRRPPSEWTLRKEIRDRVPLLQRDPRGAVEVGNCRHPLCSSPLVAAQSASYAGLRSEE